MVECHRASLAELAFFSTWGCRMKPIWNSPLTWIGIATLAVALAVASPRESGILGKLPEQIGHFLGHRQQPMATAAEEQRMLVLVSFHRDHRRDIESWIDGLSLYQDRSIAWIRMPVVQDAVGDPTVRAAAESRLLARYVTPQERENLIPVFIDREMFLRSTGLPHEQSAYVLVIKRSGEVLARIPGAFDPAKAQTVREALQDQDL